MGARHEQESALADLGDAGVAVGERQLPAGPAELGEPIKNAAQTVPSQIVRAFIDVTVEQRADVPQNGATGAAQASWSARRAGPVRAPDQ